MIGVHAAQQMKLLVVQHHNICQVIDQRMPVQQTDALTKDKALSEYTDIFDGLGRMEGQLHLRINETVSPTVMPPRRIPMAVKRKVKEELTRLKNAGVLKKVEEPRLGVQYGRVTVKCNRRVGICIDRKHNINQAHKRSHYSCLPMIEDILPDLAKARVFQHSRLQGRLSANRAG